MRARARRHACARRPRAAARRRGGARSRRPPRLRDRRPRRPGLPGGPRARPERHRRRRAELPRRPHHRQPRAGRAAQGGLRLRPADRAGLARGVPAVAPERARAHGRRGGARARRPPAPGRRRPRRRRRRAAARRRASPLSADSAREAALAGVAAMPIRHLAEAVATCAGARAEPEPPLAPNGDGGRGPDLADVRRQERARRALEPPPRPSTTSPRRAARDRKTMLARRLQDPPPLESRLHSR